MVQIVRDAQRPRDVLWKARRFAATGCTLWVQAFPCAQSAARLLEWPGGRKPGGTTSPEASKSAVSEQLQAKRFIVSGVVQGVGMRYFVQRAADRLGVAGYVKNLRDGRVEVYAIGRSGQLSDLHGQLERGPDAASVSHVSEEEAPVLPRYADGFSVEFERW